MDADEVLRELAEASKSDLGHHLTTASRAVNTEVMARLAAHGHPNVRLSHMAVFAGMQPGGSQITTLARYAGLSRQALSALVREVEALGYVRSAPDALDGRAVRVELTDAGVALCRTAIQVSAEITAAFEERWGRDVVDDLRERLREIALTDD